MSLQRGSSGWYLGGATGVSDVVVFCVYGELLLRTLRVSHSSHILGPLFVIMTVLEKHHIPFGRGGTVVKWCDSSCVYAYNSSNVQ